MPATVLTARRWPNASNKSRLTSAAGWRFWPRQRRRVIAFEIGTSAGYSTLWLAFACQISGHKLITFEILPEKVALARETFRIAGLERFVQVVQGDARQQVSNFKNVAFCFLDADKDTYMACYEAAVPNLVSGGILVADNITSHESELRPFVQHSLADKLSGCRGCAHRPRRIGLSKDLMLSELNELIAPRCPDRLTPNPLFGGWNRTAGTRLQ